MTKTELAWDDSCSFADPDIDDEHRTLHAFYATIRASLEDGNGSVDPKALCAELVDFTREHFAREEALMAAHAYPDLEMHRKLHQTFLQQIEDIWIFVRTGGEPDDYLARFVVLSFIGKWLRMHTMVVDRKFAEWLALHVRKELPAGVE